MTIQSGHNTVLPRLDEIRQIWKDDRYLISEYMEMTWNENNDYETCKNWFPNHKECFY